MLLAYSVKRVRALILITGSLLGAFQVLLIVIASSIHRTAESSSSFTSLADLLPPFVRAFFGPSMTAFISFHGMVCQGYFHPLVQGATVALAIAVGTMPTAEIESGFMDLILSRPLARHWIITRSLIVLILCMAAIIGLMLAGTWTGLVVFGPKAVAWPTLRLIGSFAVNLAFLMFAWGGVAMAFGAVSRRRGVAGTSAGLLALVMFLLDFAAQAWSPAQAVAWLSPFYYYNVLGLIMGVPLRPGDLWVLAGMAVVGFVFAQIFFAKRDLSR